MMPEVGKLPFMGEMMTCVLCGKKETSDPEKKSNWRAVDFDGERFYACPQEFPRDGASVAAFTDAYNRVFRAAREKKGVAKC